MKHLKISLTLLVLLMALLQGSFFYHYANGFGAVIIMPPYALLGCGLSLLLFFKLRDKSLPFVKYGAIAAIILGVASLFSESVIEKIDWKLRKNERIRIVNEARLQSDPRLQYDNFPPISNGSNKVMITKFTDSTLRVEFFINSGFLDHYSAFCYTDNPDEETKLEQRIARNDYGFRKLDKHWYRVSY